MEAHKICVTFPMVKVVSDKSGLESTHAQVCAAIHGTILPPFLVTQSKAPPRTLNIIHFHNIQTLAMKHPSGDFLFASLLLKPGSKCSL